MTENQKSPCACCQRVAEPNQCENKNCMYWRKWFIGRWERIRKNYLGKEKKA